ncbi:MAG: acetyl/propionyl/methylcrotonyl-CoA carboxylase subunit alpha [Minwuiales bacterium]|nr:acetyl/propionyl/methylcrotonyl-CoA carboxylase subunit alpha [Minwuiales bacterium]
MFHKILIANRGEIACRVARTAQALGIRTVAVYSEADADAMHVAAADEAYLIGPATVADSYLRADRILDAAKRSGAEAIHPGYGFLAENAAFAEACVEAGLTFIGPPPDAIRAMGLKGTAKAIMDKAGVPIVPGYHGDDQNPDLLSAEADKIGYPVLIKAVAGGGGKGMRQVNGADEFDRALEGAKREAKSAFGDDKVLLEKFLVKPRHIEIQVFADSQGNAVHLFERDCSLQRRHQKVVEEAPAPGMPLEMRQAMGEAAVAAAKAIGYVGAGTVEFIADVSDGLKSDAFYFMEMNTRLQVEHPVTEMITGQDLVEWQLQVAAGNPLPLTQDDLAIDGHALEVRVYAEDPARGFLPSTGTLSRLRSPAAEAHVRVDTGVREGDQVTPYYDPMIAKLIVWGSDRNAALRRLRQALGDYQIAGLTTNLDFLRRVAEHAGFADADLDTGFIDRNAAALLPAPPPVTDRVLALAALAALSERSGDQAETQADPYSPWRRRDGWRLNDEGHDALRFLSDDAAYDVVVHYPRGGGYRLDLPGGSLTMRGELTPGGELRAVLDGDLVRAGFARDGATMLLLVDGATVRLTLHDPLQDVGDDEGAAPTINAPLPGKIIQVMVEAGAEVQKGDPLMVLEAMKMEHTIAAPADGRVAEVNFAADDQVDEGAVLVAFEEEG